MQLDLNLGIVEFDHVRRDLDELKKAYNEQASKQFTTVAELSLASTARLTVALVLGMLFGTITIWAIQTGGVRSATQLAQLQMDSVASVSHELRTPLTAILTGGENNRDGLAQSRVRLHEQGSVITDQASQLMEVVDHVLQFPAARDAKLVDSLHELRVNDVIAHDWGSIQGVIEEAGFTIATTIEPDLPSIIADLGVLSQCVQNLIVNAINHHGIGIHASELARIFEPFYRTADAISAKIPGTGRRRSIAKHSAESSVGS